MSRVRLCGVRWYHGITHPEAHVIGNSVGKNTRVDQQTQVPGVLFAAFVMVLTGSCSLHYEVLWYTLAPTCSRVTISVRPMQRATEGGITPSLVDFSMSAAPLSTSSRTASSRPLQHSAADGEWSTAEEVRLVHVGPLLHQKPRNRQMAHCAHNTT